MSIVHDMFTKSGQREQLWEAGVRMIYMAGTIVVFEFSCMVEETSTRFLQKVAFCTVY